MTAAGVFQTPQVSVLLEATTGLAEVVEDHSPQVDWVVVVVFAAAGVVLELQPAQSSRL